MVDKDVQVSVCCITYNHEKYIAQCLDGFVMQKGVSFEVLVVDDASKDNTQLIIRDYAEKYPEIIKPVLLEENQMSKGVWTDQVYNYPRASGKYIALCEGDDFWTDPYKLKKQYDGLQNNKDCRISVHTVTTVNANASEKIEKIPKAGRFSSGKIDRKRIIDAINLGGYPFQTSSYFLDAELFKSFTSALPEFVEVSWVRDVPILLYFAYISDFYFIDEAMSSHRSKKENSYSHDIFSNKEWYSQHLQSTNEMLELFETYTGNSCDMTQAKNIYRAEYYCITDRYGSLVKLLFREFSSIKPQLRGIVILAMQYKTPELFKLLRSVKRKICRKKQ